LRLHEYFQGVDDATLEAVAAIGEVISLDACEVIHRETEVPHYIVFVMKGRLKAVKIDRHGNELPMRVIERGEQYGMILGAIDEPIPVRVFALEPSTVIRLDYEEAMQLTLHYADLRKQWSRASARSMRKQYLGDQPACAPTILALVHESAETRGTAKQLILRLHALGERIGILGDDEDWKRLDGIEFQPLSCNGVQIEPPELQATIVRWRSLKRIVIDVSEIRSAEKAANLLRFVDRVLYFVRGERIAEAMAKMKGLEIPARGWRDKISLVWVLDRGETVAPPAPGLHEYVARDFKISENPAPGPWGLSIANGFERLVHHLRGIRIGVALGGGAARGMSHLGVLKALEQSGIVVDEIAGTSAGAMTGIVYSAGLQSDYCSKQFAHALRPNWLFRRMPRGNYWYLMYKYRLGHFDPMLREYLKDWTLSQLPIPCRSVTVDLVGGKSVVRERGDAVHAILESINLPMLSIPICRDGQALIDGGLVNNIPADVLIANGCNFVIAVSVTAKMESHFARNTPETPTANMRRPSTLQTLFRSFLVQNHNLNALGVQGADVVIAPDVTGFDLTHFMRAEELAAVGEQAALEQVPRIKQLLARLDPQLFG
jgi:predicted acylesterase/phospholipase RssA/CRP-like cAMP-binding protein